MPQDITSRTIYVGPYASPETFNPTTLYQGGDLGKKFVWNGKRYQLVQVDSASQTCVANGVVFWAAKSNYTVTARVGNTANTEGVNGVAGRTPVAAAASSYIMMQIEGAATVVYGGTTNGIGDILIAKTGTTLSDTVQIAQGTAPTNMVVGIVEATSTTTSISAWLQLQNQVD